MRMSQTVTGDGLDAGSDACLPEAFIHSIHSDRISAHADKDKPIRIVKATLERCLFDLIVLGFEERHRLRIHADRSIFLVFRRFKAVSTLVIP